jgi:hypothetical protein
LVTLEMSDSWIYEVDDQDDFWRTSASDQIVVRQGCQMVYFHTKNPSLGIFWRVLEW